MKKICFALLSCLMLASSALFVGCGKNGDIESVMSERTSIYFAGQAEGVKASISVGDRENPYIKDGRHESTCDYSLSQW